MKLLIKAITKCVLGALTLGAMLFIPAGTFSFPGAWLLMGILFIPMVALGLVLYSKAPELLKKRLNQKEANRDQKMVILLSALLFLGDFILSGLDFRFGWSQAPTWAVILGAMLFLAGYGLYGEVMRENAYLSRTVEVQEGQRVIDSGLYGLLRHPMYFATMLMFPAMPLILGSLSGLLLIVLGYPPIIIWRIRDEEKTLADGLPGYREYMERVRYRLIPFIW